MGRNSLGDETKAYLGIMTKRLVLQLEGIVLVYKMVLKISTIT